MVCQVRVTRLKTRLSSAAVSGIRPGSAGGGSPGEVGGRASAPGCDQDGKSRMNREVHVRICGSREVRLLPATRPAVRPRDRASECDTSRPGRAGIGIAARGPAPRGAHRHWLRHDADSPGNTPSRVGGTVVIPDSPSGFELDDGVWVGLARSSGRARRRPDVAARDSGVRPSAAAAGRRASYRRLPR